VRELDRCALVAPAPLGILRASPRDPGFADQLDMDAAMGLKKKPKARTARFELRLLPEEAIDIEGKAAKAGISVSEFIRRCALGKRIDVRYKEDAILALRDIAITVGELRNVVATSPRGFDDEAFKAIAAECVNTIRRVV